MHPPLPAPPWGAPHGRCISNSWDTKNEDKIIRVKKNYGNWIFEKGMNKRETISYFDFDLSQATCHIEQHQYRSPVCNQKKNLSHATKKWFRGSD